VEASAGRRSLLQPGLAELAELFPIETVARGLHDTKYYTMGCKQLYVATDHKSLVCVLGDQSLTDVENPRLARIKERKLWWQFTIVHTPGKLQLAADALSRRKTKQNSRQQFIRSESMNQKMKRKKLPKILRTGSSTTSQNPKPVKTEHMAPFRHWLSQFQPFVWDKTMETTFRKSKERIRGLHDTKYDAATECLGD
jgi:hypothetical protein